MKMQGYLYELMREVALLTGVQPQKEESMFFEELTTLKSNQDRVVEWEEDDTLLLLRITNRGLEYYIEVSIKTIYTEDGAIHHVVIRDELA